MPYQSTWTWQDRAAASEPRGVSLDPQSDPVEGVQAFPTHYAPGHLLITGDAGPAIAELNDAAAELGWAIQTNELIPDRKPTPGPGPGLDITPRDTRLTQASILPASTDQGTSSVAPVDAWRLLQQARRRKKDAPAEGRDPVRRIPAIAEPVASDDPLRAVGLDHVLYVAKSTDRYARTNPVDTDRYARTNPGGDGHTVVDYVGQDPQPQCAVYDGGRRPVVAVFDTGCGQHAWLPDRGADPNVPSVWRKPAPQWGGVIGIDEPQTDPEVHPDLTGPFDGALDKASGHGTFACGIVRQQAPDANLIAVRVADSDGSVLESELLTALEQLAAWMANEDDPLALDVLNLSLGFYHETPEDGRFTRHLYEVLLELRERGVVVVCSAGNDATDRPAFPAALWDWGDPTLGITENRDLPPLISVGALNSTRRSVALYSNIGPWVAYYAPGTSVLSTFPQFEGGSQAGARDDRYNLLRMTTDPDNFGRGFATWSGTSFAAPYISGAVAQNMAKELTSTGERPPLARGDLLDILTPCECMPAPRTDDTDTEGGTPG